MHGEKMRLPGIRCQVAILKAQDAHGRLKIVRDEEFVFNNQRAPPRGQSFFHSDFRSPCLHSID
jgi:hypothetical protein